MGVSPPGGTGKGEQGAEAVRADCMQGAPFGDHDVQDNRFTQVTAGRDALVAGGDFRVQELHVHVGDADGGITGRLLPDSAILPVLPVAARSAYVEQVRRIARRDPPGLLGRDAELAELAQFCLAPDGPSYAWWQAGPWAGKSALLSTFVLRPPSEVAGRVTIVSFFITARLAAQDTRQAFTQVLAEQLAASMGHSLPTALPEATREVFLLSLLSRTAAECADRGGRLVLVVDGLDEDQGVTTGRTPTVLRGCCPVIPRPGCA